ncbi:MULTISPECIES: acetate--CoA ligase family protein [unclassified Methanoregula]|uniref:acetate--CoA ligase family protein n=1 Tax=unclassified Methanoregula TaxID=2649730 RepID=UPI0009CA3408|nr:MULTISPECIES: acetate--CoA ligase family protein [unclassified Methanoregula]OPX62580.1 MAG: succinyl-CoA synthetase subunit alpha [Methanoregula sp. PtaB.Bin085]OPY34976.1 MAG: succinyl-CoA synthetase subunit alpha [Methanoregula sp. PtaU1.Bin006]
MARQLLPEAEGYALLKNAGIPVPRFSVAQSREDAAKAADTIGCPVVMKVVSQQVVHKSDAGGVVLNIRTPAEAAAAFDTISRNVKQNVPGAVIDGIIVVQQLTPGLELIIGGKTDPAFGKVITIGAGGTLVELLRDVSLRVLPIDETEIRAMVHELKVSRLIAGYRNQSARDEEAFVAAVTAAARWFLQTPRVKEFDLNPMVLYEKGGCVIDARIYVDDAPEPVADGGRPELPDRLLSIGSIAVVGASQDPNKVGYAITRNLLQFRGSLYPVNPKAEEILGKKAYPSLSAVPATIDLVVIAIPAKGVPQIVKEAGEKKVPLVIIISSGFREAGEAGRALESEVLATARQYGIRIMGPNCLGLMLPHQGINTTFDPVSPKPGKIAFISQSGAIITTIVDWSLPEEIGLSAVISVGNQADLTFEDFVRFAGNDKETKAIILYAEQIRDGRKFMETVSRITPTKPVVVIKAGASAVGQKAASSHTGSLAGSHAVYMAAFRQAGVIPVNSIRGAFQTAELLASEGYPRGTRAVVITNAGGFGVLSSDYAEQNGITMIEFSHSIIDELNAVLPPDWSRANPIDMVGDSSADRFAKTFDIMIRNQDIWDIAFVIAVPSAISDPIRVANEIVRFSKHTRKMIVGCMIGGDSMKTPLRILRDAQIPNFPDLEDAFKAVGTIGTHRCSTDSVACRHGE